MVATTKMTIMQMTTLVIPMLMTNAMTITMITMFTMKKEVTTMVKLLLIMVSANGHDNVVGDDDADLDDDCSAFVMR